MVTGTSRMIYAARRLITVCGPTPLGAANKHVAGGLAARTGTFGTAPGELADVLFWPAGFPTAYRASGATLIDARRPLPEVVAETLAASWQARGCGATISGVGM